MITLVSKCYQTSFPLLSCSREINICWSTLIKGKLGYSPIIFPLFCLAPLTRFSQSNFTFSDLTLFSKFYFNFPSQYLFAIGLIVLFSVRSHLPPIVNFIHQSQDVLLSSQRRSLNTLKKNLRDYHSLWCSFPTDFNSLSKCQLLQPISYNSLSTYFNKDFNFALYPFHSPLLRVSLLISFPPVNDMLKFTGWFVMKRWKCIFVFYIF